jgi:hypothetical protein
MHHHCHGPISEGQAIDSHRGDKIPRTSNNAFSKVLTGTTKPRSNLGFSPHGYQ